MKLNQLHKQDVWATGIILMQLISGERYFPDFKANRKKMISEMIGRRNLPHEKSMVIIDLLGKMLVEESEKRLSAIEALKHEVFKIVWGDDMMTAHSQAEVIHKIMHYVTNFLFFVFQVFG